MLALILTLLSQGSQTVTPKSGLVISHSADFAAGSFFVPSSAADGAAIRVRGDNLVVDFHGATLRGTSATAQPDTRVGTGLDVSGHNIVIKNAIIRGYKVGLFAHNAPGLKLLRCNFSYNWKQHLRSTLEREDLSDWQSYHHNEQREWLRYGAGAYLEDCNDFEVRNCITHGGQCALMLSRCDNGRVWNNDFSFMSGLGLGMYRSSGNVVMHNKLDWCVRGFSYGVYNRGQDSSGILIYEQSNHNVFAYNSVTHGGDGFFLWAGQHTMDTGDGGCNDNLLYGNDFSHSPANGIEATFSRNTFVHNLCAECDYGIWGGYSFDSLALDNVVTASRVGMAFEHSQNCLFKENLFVDCKTGIQLWGGGKPDPNFGYSKAKDVRSIGNSIRGNRFVDATGASVSLKDTIDSSISANESYNDRPADADSSNVGLMTDANIKALSEYTPITWSTSKEYPGNLANMVRAFWTPSSVSPEARKFAPKPIPGGQNAFLPDGALRGRRYMLVDEWGPYDFKYPRIWPRGENAKGQKVFEILGPKGAWKVETVSGASVVGAKYGSMPGMLTVAMPSGKALDVRLKLQFVGEAVTDYRGVATPAGHKVDFGYSQFFAPITWKFEFFQWDKDSDPRKDEHAFRVLLAGPPIAEAKSDRFDFSGYGAWAKGVPENYFAISANGDFETAGGKFALDITTDDGCRVFLDGKPLQLFDENGKPANAFHYQGPTAYSAPMVLAKGRHHLYVEYFQIDGYKTIQVRLKKQ